MSDDKPEYIWFGYATRPEDAWRRLPDSSEWIGPTEGWFTTMARVHCGRDYGTEQRNQYFFYRKVYGFPALRAIAEVRRFAASMRTSSYDNDR